MACTATAPLLLPTGRPRMLVKVKVHTKHTSNSKTSTSAAHEARDACAAGNTTGNATRRVTRSSDACVHEHAVTTTTTTTVTTPTMAAAAAVATATATAATSTSATPHEQAVATVVVPTRLLQCGVSSTQGRRRTMEDQHTMVSGGVPFFGVYDGHGGTQCAEFLRDHLHTMILGHADLKTHPERAIRESIIAADRAFLQRSEAETNESGSVCAVAVIVDDLLVVGNVGDCEAVLSRNGAPIVLTVKHKLQSNAAELERVRGVGGRIFHNRVGHPKFNPSVISLAVTRAIGDAGFKLDEYTDGKPSGIIAVPDTSSTRLTSEDDFFVIGCDGLWDVMSYDEVIDFCALQLKDATRTAHTVAYNLVDEALCRGSGDNLTVSLVVFRRADDVALS